MNSEWKSRYGMVEAARAAGQVALGYFDMNIAVEQKPDESPVTIADREAEQTLARDLSPSILMTASSARSSARRGSSGYRWIIDPTTDARFIRNIPHCPRSLASNTRGDDASSYAPADGRCSVPFAATAHTRTTAASASPMWRRSTRRSPATPDISTSGRPARSGSS